MSNFRMTLISKCIGDAGAVEAKSDVIAEVLHGNGDVDLPKLRNFAWRHDIPRQHRAETYKKLLGVSSCYSETRATVAKHREEEVEVLLKCLKNIRQFTGIVKDGDILPNTSDITKLILLARGQLRLSDFSQSKLDSSEFVREVYSITRQINRFLGGNWKDVFFIARGLVDLLDSTFDDKIVHDLTKQIETTIGSNCEEYKIPLRLRTALCGVITSDKAMLRILDKVVTGHGLINFVKNLVLKWIQSMKQAATNNEKLIQGSEDPELRWVVRSVEQTTEELTRRQRR